MRYNYLVGTDATVRPKSRKGSATTAYSVLVFDYATGTLHCTYEDVTILDYTNISEVEFLALLDAVSGNEDALIVSDSIPAISEYLGYSVDPLEGYIHSQSDIGITWVPAHKMITSELRAINYLADKLLKPGAQHVFETTYVTKVLNYLPIRQVIYNN